MATDAKHTAATMMRNSQTKRSQRSYPMRATARAPMIITEVGVIKLIVPDADWYAVTTIERDTLAKSASGARIGMARAACPELEGIRKASGRLMMYIRPANPAEVLPETTPSREWRTVSVIKPLCIITV